MSWSQAIPSSAGWRRAGAWRSATSTIATKTQRSYPVIGGCRYAVPGDRARLRADGVVELHGRDSVTINSGGEKIFAEEVEAAIKSHEAVYDCVVAGRAERTLGPGGRRDRPPPRRPRRQPDGADRRSRTPHRPLQAPQADRVRRRGRPLPVRQGRLPLGQAGRRLRLLVLPGPNIERCCRNRTVGPRSPPLARQIELLDVAHRGRRRTRCRNRTVGPRSPPSARQIELLDLAHRGRRRTRCRNRTVGPRSPPLARQIELLDVAHRGPSSARRRRIRHDDQSGPTTCRVI